MGLLRRSGRGFIAWVDDRTGVIEMLGKGRELIMKPVPRGLSWWYTLGSIALFLFALQFLTGSLLLVHYVPQAAAAYRSVEEIQHHVPLGWLVRQMHSWGASFVVTALVLHMLKVLWYGGYKRPREFTWFVGVLLLGVALAFCFTGYLLPWNQLARWATAVGTDVVAKIPVIGGYLMRLMSGGEGVSGETVGRFFAVHVFLLPLGLIVLMMIHLGLVQRHGISTHLRVDEEEILGYKLALERAGGASTFFPRQVYRDLLAITVTFGLLVLAATFWPWELGPPASDTTPAGIKPEWYFLPVYQLLKYFDAELFQGVPFLSGVEHPELVGLVAINLAGLALLLLPILDRSKERRIWRRPIFAIVFAASLVGVVGLGVLGRVSSEERMILGQRYRFTSKGYPEKVVAPEAGAPPAGALTRETPPAPAGPTHEDLAAKAAGTCGPCHKRQLREWTDGLHSRGDPMPAKCVDCHGGDAASDDKDVAHKGILTRPPARTGGRERAKKPAGKEVVEICGKCHTDVKQQFSDRHLELDPPKACSGCHDNHQVVHATPAIFDKGYEGEDPRAAPMLEVRGKAIELEERWGLYQQAVESLTAQLREHEHPLRDFAEEETAAANARREARVLTHTLDAGKVAPAVKSAVEAMETHRKSLETRVTEIHRRAYLGAAVGTVSFCFAALLAGALWRLRRSGVQ